MELTKEYFDKTIASLLSKKDAESFMTKKDAEPFITKKDAESFMTKKDAEFLLTKKDAEKLMSKKDGEAMEKRIIEKVVLRIDEAQEELALMTKNGFDDVLARIDKIDARERVNGLERDMKQLKTALDLQ